MTQNSSTVAPSRTIVLIGGGSVGTAFLCQLSMLMEKTSYAGVIRRVVLFEPNESPGAGQAYQMDTPSNLLNTRVSSMSVLASEPEHFYDWLCDFRVLWQAEFPDLQVTPDAFVPRALFGLYLNHVYKSTVSRLSEQGILFEHVKERASSVHTNGEHYLVKSSHSLRVQAGALVLAMGNFQTTAWSHLQALDGYFDTPYPCSKLISEIDKLHSVCIIGSSLSAIDAAVSLSDAGHVGKITMVSRHGRLPSVRGEKNLHRSSKLLSRERLQALLKQRSSSTLTLREIAQALFEELETSEGRAPCLVDILRTGCGPQRYLDLEIQDAQAQDRSWQAVLYALNDAIDLIWHLLSETEKRTFQTQYKSLWHAYRVSFPIENARKLQKLLHSGQLTVHAAYREASWDTARERFAIAIGDASQRFEATLYTDKLINATGYTTNLEQCHAPLLQQMREQGLLRSNEFGGIDLEFESGLILSNAGTPLPGLYALGSLASGTYFWTNAMSVNTRLAANVAERILKIAYQAYPTANETASYRLAA